jgi:hypothetical protein
MDAQARHDMYTLAEWAATMDALDRLHQRRARRRQAIHFWFNLHQIAADPASAVPDPGVSPSPTAPLGSGSGLAGSETTPPNVSPANPH